MTANQLVSQIAREIGGSGSAHLAMSIEEVRKYLPREISLRKLVYPKVAKDVGRETRAVERSVSRAVKSCWDYGNHAVIDEALGIRFKHCPPPKKFILYLAYYLQYGIAYHKIKEAGDGRDYPLIF